MTVQFVAKGHSSLFEAFKNCDIERADGGVYHRDRPIEETA